MTADTDIRPALDAAAEADVAAFLSGLMPGTGTPGPDTPLVSGGRLDSLGVLQLVGFLGERFGIAVEDEDFTEENFATVGTLLAFVARKARA